MLSTKFAAIESTEPATERLAVAPAPVAVIGYGNALRRDDGAGIALAEAIVGCWAAQGFQTHLLTDMQLLPEMAEVIANLDVHAVVFVDTSVVDTSVVDTSVVNTPDVGTSSESGNAIQVEAVDLDTPSASMGHQLDPTALLVYAALLYDRYPRAWLVTVPGRDFGHGEGFSPQVRALLKNPAVVANELMETIKESLPCMN